MRRRHSQNWFSLLAAGGWQACSKCECVCLHSIIIYCKLHTFYSARRMALAIEPVTPFVHCMRNVVRRRRRGEVGTCNLIWLHLSPVHVRKAQLCGHLLFALLCQPVSAIDTVALWSRCRVDEHSKCAGSVSITAKWQSLVCVWVG